MRRQAEQAQQSQEPRGTRLARVKVDAFSGSVDGYDDWAFTFKKGVKAHDPSAYELLCAAEAPLPDAPVTEETLESEGLPGDVRLSAELYDLLCTNVKGEALAIVRSCRDMFGMVAWRKLYDKYAPRTMARAIRMVSAVTSRLPQRSRIWKKWS